MKTIFLIGFLALASLSSFGQKFEGLAKTPPMGWNSWNRFACNVSEDLIKSIADAMVSSGMRDAGYRYIVIDDCWHGGRDSLGFITAHPERFPSGMRALADYIHSLGLKFGIYSCAGNRTCAGYPGSRGHEYQDALVYASWGVDYLKYDWCDTEGLSAIGAYTTMSQALAKAGRPVMFSLCEWGQNQPWKWGKNVGHLWRTTGDIHNCFDCAFNHGTWTAWGAMRIVDMQYHLRQYHGPDGWNDPDMLQVGNGMPFNENRAHFTIWCMLAAPMMAGNDLRDMSPETLSILTNREAIAIDQDPLGIQGFRYQNIDSLEIWVKPLVDGDVAIAFLNRSATPRSVEFNWRNHKIQDPIFQEHVFDFRANTYNIRNIWEGKDAGNTNRTFRADLIGRDVVMMRLTPAKK